MTRKYSSRPNRSPRYIQLQGATKGQNEGGSGENMEGREAEREIGGRKENRKSELEIER